MNNSIIYSKWSGAHHLLMNKLINYWMIRCFDSFELHLNSGTDNIAAHKVDGILCNFSSRKMQSVVG